DLFIFHRIPREKLTAIAAWSGVHTHVRAYVRRARDVVRLEAFGIHAEILVRDVHQPRLWRERGWLPVFRAGRRWTDLAHDLADFRFLLLVVDDPAGIEIDAF